jgi:hypothetical protein
VDDAADGVVEAFQRPRGDVMHVVAQRIVHRAMWHLELLYGPAFAAVLIIAEASAIIPAFLEPRRWYEQLSLDRRMAPAQCCLCPVWADVELEQAGHRLDASFEAWTS